ncbi:thioredoxin-like protein [Xylogone sp. PMI_703]|nr:thioredoxin-like protein [Xylogone sp. PMI_703]
MANLDSKVASVLDASHSDDEDALIAALEESSEIDAFREQRIQQLHSEFTRAKLQQEKGFGNYTEIREEKALMDLTTELKYVVVHFAKDDFARCGVMDRHLEVLAPKHFDTRFLKINVDNAPFLVTKLKVQVLPCVLAFIDGICIDRIIGFEGLGRTQDTFTTKDLEFRLLNCGVIQRTKITEGSMDNPSMANKKKDNYDDDNDDDEWD